jgi:hypothetical protein
MTTPSRRADEVTPRRPRSVAQGTAFVLAAAAGWFGHRCNVPPCGYPPLRCPTSRRR